MGWRSLMGRGSGRSPSLILLAMGYHHCLYFYHDFKMYVFTTDVENDINKHRNHKRRHVFYLVRHSIYALGGSAGGRRLCRTPTSRQVSWHAAMDACWSCWSRGSCQRDFRQQVSHSLAIRCGWGTSLVPGSPGNYSEQTHGRTALRILHDSVCASERKPREAKTKALSKPAPAVRPHSVALAPLDWAHSPSANMQSAAECIRGPFLGFSLSNHSRCHHYHHHTHSHSRPPAVVSHPPPSQMVGTPSLSVPCFPSAAVRRHTPFPEYE